MDDTTEAIAPLERPGRQRMRFGWLSRSELVEPLVRPGVEVVVDELGQHFLQMTAAEDQHVVQHLPQAVGKNYKSA